jgi:hypothetical protein
MSYSKSTIRKSLNAAGVQQSQELFEVWMKFDGCHKPFSDYIQLHSSDQLSFVIANIAFLHYHHEGQ